MLLFSVLMLFYRFCYCFFFFKQKTAYEMRISDWSSDVCSSDLDHRLARRWVSLRSTHPTGLSRTQRRAHRLGRMRRNLEQRLCCATRFAAALFPVLQRAHGNTEHAGEVRLRQAELGARLGGFGHFDVEHAAGLAGLDLTHGLQQFFADVAPGVTLDELG